MQLWKHLKNIDFKEYIKTASNFNYFFKVKSLHNDGIYQEKIIIKAEDQLKNRWVSLWWCWVDSNHRLTDFQSDALPPELQHQHKIDANLQKYKILAKLLFLKLYHCYNESIKSINFCFNYNLFYYNNKKEGTYYKKKCITWEKRAQSNYQ